jgi:hypothetical protein
LDIAQSKSFHSSLLIIFLDCFTTTNSSDWIYYNLHPIVNYTESWPSVRPGYGFRTLSIELQGTLIYATTTEYVANVIVYNAEAHTLPYVTNQNFYSGNTTTRNFYSFLDVLELTLVFSTDLPYRVINVTQNAGPHIAWLESLYEVDCSNNRCIQGIEMNFNGNIVLLLIANSQNLVTLMACIPLI